MSTSTGEWTEFCCELGMASARALELEELLVEFYRLCQVYLGLTNVWVQILDSKDQIVAEVGRCSDRRGFRFSVDEQLHGRLECGAGPSDRLASVAQWSIKRFLSGMERHRQRREQILQTIHLSLARVVGEDFFPELVSQLGQLLGVRYAMVSRVDRFDSARAIAIWVNGELQDGFEYSLAGTPCWDVTSELASCCFPTGVQAEFPEDDDLVTLGVDGYLGTPVFHPAGHVIGLLVVMDDKPMEDVLLRTGVLEVVAARAGAEMVRRDAEKALRDSETYFRTLVEQSPVAKLVFSSDGTLQSTNQAFLSLCSLEREALEALSGDFNIRDSLYFRGSGSDLVDAAFSGELVVVPEQQMNPRSFLGGKVEGAETRELWLSSVLQPLKDRCGNVGGVVLVLQDLTQRKESERKSRQLSERLRLALKAGSFGVWDWDVRQNVLVWDDFMYDIYGVTPEEFGGAYEAWEAGVHPEDMESSVARLQEALAGTQSFDTQFRIIRPDGQTRYVSAHAVVIRDTKGDAKRMIGVNADITEQAKAQSEKEELQEQLHHARRMESVGRLAGGVAHDFNNMLSAIIGNVDLAIDLQENNEPLDDELTEIRKAAMRSAELTHQLLAFARKQTIAPVPLELNPLVESVFRMLERLVGEQITLLWEPASDLWAVLIDPAQMDQVIINLCVNARDAITGAGQITVATKNVSLGAEELPSRPGLEAGDYIELSVRDNGSGMDEATLRRVFEPFFTTKPQGKGTGLGLATVYGIVQQNGGFIDIESTLGAGTEVTIRLPRYLGEVSELPKTARKASGGSETVLLVEDQQQVLRVTKKMLRNLGYKVIASTNPVQALALASQTKESIDLLLTDVIMPEMHGCELAKELRLQRPNLRCLFMSGYTGDAISEHGVLDEGLNFLSKPFTQSDLLSKVKEALLSRP